MSCEPSIQVLSQAPENVGLEWTFGDVVSIAATVLDVDWSGTYTAEVRRADDPTSTKFADLTITAVYAAPDTALTIGLADSTDVPVGLWWWSMRQTGGTTRLHGTVRVLPSPTAP